MQVGQFSNLILKRNIAPSAKNDSDFEKVSSFKNNSLTASPAQDIFTHQSSTCKTHAEQIFNSAQDRLLAKFYPEKFILKYSNIKFLQQAIKNNPTIANILAIKNVPVNIEPTNVSSITQSHLIPTMNFALGIMKNSNEKFTQNDYENMRQASLIHDVGKALIPSEILNKKGALDKNEKEIVDLHNRLGYELLKNSSLNNNVKFLVLNHHSHNNPKTDNNLVQILKVADIYSALKEDRPYKKPMDDKKAFAILLENAEKGEFDKKYIESLKRYLEIKKNT